MLVCCWSCPWLKPRKKMKKSQPVGPSCLEMRTVSFHFCGIWALCVGPLDFVWFSFTSCLSSFQEHQCWRGAQQAEAEASPGARRCPEEEGDGQDAAREGQTVQTREEGKGEKAHTKRRTQKIRPRRWEDFLGDNVLLQNMMIKLFFMILANHIGTLQIWSRLYPIFIIHITWLYLNRTKFWIEVLDLDSDFKLLVSDVAKPIVIGPFLTLKSILSEKIIAGLEKLQIFFH